MATDFGFNYGAPAPCSLRGALLDEAGILDADEEVLIPMAIFGLVAPYIVVKTWLWVRQGFAQDRE